MFCGFVLIFMNKSFIDFFFCAKTECARVFWEGDIYLIDFVPLAWTVWHDDTLTMAAAITKRRKYEEILLKAIANIRAHIHI